VGMRVPPLFFPFDQQDTVGEAANQKGLPGFPPGEAGIGV
jgi:hypothetical protein